MSELNMQEKIEKTKSILKEELNTVRAGLSLIHISEPTRH